MDETREAYLCHAKNWFESLKAVGSAPKHALIVFRNENTGPGNCLCIAYPNSSYKNDLPTHPICVEIWEEKETHKSRL